MTTIQASEVAEVFRQALRGEIMVKVQGVEGWSDIGSGNFSFEFGDWVIVVFNDCMEFDYVDNVIAPDGRTAEFEHWEVDPVGLLTCEEIAGMESLVEGLLPCL
jgi:hypothetical protein